MLWVGRRDLNPQLPQSQCGALPFELRPTEEFRISDPFQIRNPNSAIRNLMVRVERFELIIELILSQPPLPVGLHAQ